MNEIITSNPQEAVIKYYKPSELLGMFTAYLSRQDVNSQVIYLRGIYLKNAKHDPRWSYRYDILRDEDTQTEITLQMTQKQSEELKDGNLVTVGGVLGRRVQNNSHIQLMLVVSRIEIVSLKGQRLIFNAKNTIIPIYADRLHNIILYLHKK